jgi:hypothetical protein
MNLRDRNTVRKIVSEIIKRSEAILKDPLSAVSAKDVRNEINRARGVRRGGFFGRNVFGEIVETRFLRGSFEAIADFLSGYTIKKTMAGTIKIVKVGAAAAGVVGSGVVALCLAALFTVYSGASFGLMAANVTNEPLRFSLHAMLTEPEPPFEFPESDPDIFLYSPIFSDSGYTDVVLPDLTLPQEQAAPPAQEPDETPAETPAPPAANQAATSGSLLGMFRMTYATHPGFGDEYIYFFADGTCRVNIFFMADATSTFSVDGNIVTIVMTYWGESLEWQGVIEGNTVTIDYFDTFGDDFVMVFTGE